MNLKLDLTVDETKNVLFALQKFPMDQVRPLVTKIEAQASEQLKPKKEEAAPVGEVLNEVNVPKGPAVNG